MSADAADGVGLRLVPVSELPAPHHLFRCPHRGRLAAHVRGSAEPEEADALRDGWRRFLAGLTAADLATCPYHRGDWVRVAAEARRILLALRADPDAGPWDELVGEDLDDDDYSWLASLFEDTMWLCGDRWGNGQHRGCALRVSGVEQTVVKG